MGQGSLHLCPALLSLVSAVLYGIAVVGEYVANGYSVHWPYAVYSAIYFVAYLALVFSADPSELDSPAKAWASLVLSAIGVAISVPAIYPFMVLVGLGGAVSLLITLYYLAKLRYAISRARCGALVSVLKVLPIAAVYPVIAYHTAMTLYELYTFGRPPQLHELKYYWLLVYSTAYGIAITVLPATPEELSGARGAAIAMNAAAAIVALVAYLALPHPQRLAVLASLPTLLALTLKSLLFRPRPPSKWKAYREPMPRVRGEFV